MDSCACSGPKRHRTQRHKIFTAFPSIPNIDFTPLALPSRSISRPTIRENVTLYQGIPHGSGLRTATLILPDDDPQSLPRPGRSTKANRMVSTWRSTCCDTNQKRDSARQSRRNPSLVLPPLTQSPPATYRVSQPDSVDRLRSQASGRAATGTDQPAARVPARFLKSASAVKARSNLSTI
ncbi:hypothetical protein EXIGLDRAFT_201624 [Exidia glandulosa HHB12029]|uniref:Uncharacterized protein n=1 Tax=Exidia glandulosa HHB12029 TaxID=1314781 RepID=A0A166A0M1_EXIGL|nr:hypothetical protein EXIGLDRAFT_201624 [Exidia glandulosa HHB12029]